MTQDTAMALLYLVYFFVAVQAAPVHQLKGEALELAERNGFLSDDYDRLHVIKLSEYLSDSLHPLDMGRLRKRRETQERTKLNVPINGVNYSLSLHHSRPVLHPNAEIYVSNGSEESEERHYHPTRSCHLVGDIEDYIGSASFSDCDRLRGVMVVDDVEYILEHMEDEQHLVAERRKPETGPFEQYDDLIQEEIRYFTESESETEVSVPVEPYRARGLELRPKSLFGGKLTKIDESRSSGEKVLTDDTGSKDESAEDNEKRDPAVVVVEMVVYTDEAYTALLDKAKADTVQKKVDYVISKFTGVQYEYDKIQQLERVVNFQIKKMVFYKKNPDWLKVTGNLGPMLGSLCNWNKNKKAYDIVYMITGHDGMYPVGLAWVAGACRPTTRCGVSIGTAWGRYVAIAHEIGHLLGMNHDFSTKCKTMPQKQLGLMGGKGTDFSPCSVEDFHKALKNPDKKCLFTKNIPDDEVMPELKDVVLGNIPTVAGVTHHQYCEKLMGPGYRYREKEGMLYSCDRGYYCVQLKDGPDFGLIYRERAKGIVGMYCAPGKVCLKGQCLSYKLMTLHSDWVVREGGWGDWSDWTPCSRPCGTGIKYSHRECNNPTPIQHRYCDGNEYRAELCNTKPCHDDPEDTAAVIKSRADETCKRLAKVLNTKHQYKETGRVYGTKGYDDVCDAHCDNQKDSNSRDAILPDGTPCSSADPKNDVDTRENVKLRCFRGKCQVFGCDGKFPADVYGSDPECIDIVG